MIIIYIPTLEYEWFKYPLLGKVIVREWFIGIAHGRTQTYVIAGLKNYGYI